MSFHMRPLRLTALAALFAALAHAPAAAAAPGIALDHPMAPFLESRAFAKAQGATAEFNKMEGVALDPVNRKLYLAMSSIKGGMSDQSGDLQLAENPCGAVYAADLDENWEITSLTPVVVGGPYRPDDAANRCSVESVANPDNLFVDSQGTLWIGEDTEEHANNYLWSWNGSELKRFAAVPAGAEVTGLFITPEGSMFLNFQHPDAMNLHPFNRGGIGVITGYAAGEAFTELPVPTGDAARQVTVAAGAYQLLARSGDAIPGEIRGEVAGQRTNADGSFTISNNPDGNMFLPTDASGTEGYLYTNFESRPGGVIKQYIRRNGSGWEVLEGENVDFMPVNGTWNNCFASVTPWNTGLTSEEYEPAVTDEWMSAVAAMSTYLGRQANPYDYGYNVELSPNGVGTKVTKRYAMGRFSHENALVMPDGRTVYQTDDGGDVVLFKFIADKEGDLSSGTLYAAKMTQVNEGDSYRLDLSWVKLGAGNDAAVAAAIRELDGRLGQ